ncbi:Por secretion system C-terminal sorting domain-containing protein [Mariniphaga anaerophila]|uniref:Por secretion system C-terminal sorting domain-containing protein n=1 Tax=Mariniphaga anaerophila TaxID=1484053 RepID=A0A1M4SMW4_9BACT|nr:family 10 glycosylhydrolase [Mariniphaga anaerophila]SHE33614.1 Por secretion system C-terminal sorting domain-containing protein [Mariniphaga anaerophila]
MIRNFTLFLITFFLISASFYSGAQIPKRELRSSWLTTVWGLDWPGIKIPSGGGQIYIDRQKEQLSRILDSMQVAGTNAVFFQVRPECDAMYPSSFEPWSAYLVSNRGADPGYDPLQYAVDECHKRGLELHAWLNPYRFESVAGKYAGQPGDYNQTNPEWVLSYSGGGSILDPGNPAVRQRISDIVEEIVVNYDIDGIVFDDYFYAYGGTPSSMDQYSQNNWKPANMDLHDWRRQNVNKMVADVYETIQKNKPWVTFGVSPFGIWTVDSQVAASYGLSLPSGVTGMDAYKTIYCDPVAWLNEGTVDYISPQLYWPTTSTGQDYKKLAPWWSDVVNHFGRHLYVSHSLSNLDESDYPPPLALKSAYSNFLRTDLQGLSMIEYFSKMSSKTATAGYDPSEFGLQIQWNRNSDKNNAPGSVFFRSTMIYRQGFMNYLRTHEYENRALPPVKPWNSKEDRSLPQNIRIENDRLLWNSDEENVRFVVYAIPELQIENTGNFNDGKYIRGIAYSTSFDLTDLQSLVDDHVFAVAVFDRNGNEFPPVIMGKAPQENHPVTLLSPEDEENIYHGFMFDWEDVNNAESYLLEVAADSLFKSVVARHNLAESEFSSSNIPMEEDSVYYWRVYTRMAGVKDTVSEKRSFKLLELPRPRLVYPLNETANVELTPVIQWEPFEEGYTFRMQISTNNSFTGIIFDQDLMEGTAFELPLGVIFSYSSYYLRMQAASDQSTTVWSDVVRFSTVTTPPSIPTIISPSKGESVAGPEVDLTVSADELAKGFTFQLSGSSTFPWNDRIQQSIDAPLQTLTMSGLKDGTWYAKARANYGTSSYTDWSEVVSFSLLTTSSGAIDDLKLSLFAPTLIADGPIRISYTLPKNSRVKLFITDLTGRRVKQGQHSFKLKGEHSLYMQGAELPRGLYFLTLETEYGRETLKLIK